MNDETDKTNLCFSVILSCHKYIESRIKTQNIEELPFRYRYFIGKDEDKKNDNKNIISLDCLDNYESLHYKVYEAIKWIDENVEYEYILKTDDDIPFKKDSIKKIYNKFVDGGYDYCGYFTLVKNGHMSSWHCGKCEDSKINKAQVYCPPNHYASGGAYFLSKRFVKHYLETFPKMDKKLIYEDAFMGRVFSECEKVDGRLKKLDGVNKEILEAFNWV